MTLSPYDQLKNYVSEQFVLGTKERYSEVLSSLKELFREGINSIRRFEQINSISQLVRVLELRDLLSEDNVECLMSIASKLPHSKDVLKKITDYENLHVPRENGNFIPLQAKKENGDSYINASSLPCNDIVKKKQIIMQTITEEIGSFWRDLGRNLRIRECEIDDIDFHNKSLPVKARKLMEIFDRKADKQKWFFVLCDALDKSRRRDLSRSIQEIITMNI